MGDIADWVLDAMCEVDEFGLDGFDKVTIDPDTHEVIPVCPRRPKTCRACRTTDLHWEQLKGKWRLFDEHGKIHKCPVKPL